MNGPAGGGGYTGGKGMIWPAIALERICGRGAGPSSGHARARGRSRGFPVPGAGPRGFFRVCCRRAGFDLSLSFARWIYTAAGGGVVKPRARPGGGLRIARVPPAVIV